MTLSKQSWQLLLLLTIVGLSGIYADFFLSFGAYVDDSARFIKYEALREVVYFFTDGTIPLILTISIISVPLVMYYFVKWYEEHDKFKFRNEYAYMLIIFIYFLFTTRLFAGLTWYNTVFVRLVPNIQTLSFICLGGIFVFIVLMYKEDKYEYKNTNQNYS